MCAKYLGRESTLRQHDSDFFLPTALARFVPPIPAITTPFTNPFDKSLKNPLKTLPRTSLSPCALPQPASRRQTPAIAFCSRRRRCPHTYVYAQGYAPTIRSRIILPPLGCRRSQRPTQTRLSKQTNAGGRGDGGARRQWSTCNCCCC